MKSTPSSGPPSPFYQLVSGGTPYTLIFSMEEDGPPVLPEGVASDCPEAARAEMDVLPLGGNRYRLCESNPFLPDLYSGDEFLADEVAPGTLRLVGIPEEQPYRHSTRLMGAPPERDGPLEMLIHSLGGGWELFFQGLLVISIPAENWEVFEARTAAELSAGDSSQ